MMRNRILWILCPIAILTFGYFGVGAPHWQDDSRPQTFLVSKKPASYYDEEACDEEEDEISEEEFDDDEGRRTRVVEIRYGRGIEHDYRLEEEDDGDDEFDWVRHG